jgi:hypothetical protein
MVRAIVGQIEVTSCATRQTRSATVIEATERGCRRRPKARAECNNETSRQKLDLGMHNISPYSAARSTPIAIGCSSGKHAPMTYGASQVD